MSLALRTTIVAALLVAAAPALADEEACFDAHRAGQEARLDHRLVEARQRFVRCASEAACPEVVTDDCETWIAELDAEIPSIVVAVSDDAGREIEPARTLVDQAEVETRTGASLPLDPGRHVVRVELADGTHLETTVTARQGERNRLVRLRAEGAPSPSGLTGLGYAGIVLSAVGLVGLTAFGVLGGMVVGRHADLEESCPMCSRDDIQQTERLAVGADVALGIGASSLAAGVLLLSIDLATPSPTSPGSAMLRLGGRF